MKTRLFLLSIIAIALFSCRKSNTAEEEYDDNGNLHRKTVYFSPDDKTNFRTYEYYENKNLKELHEFENGIPQGRSFSYYPNGQIKSVFYFESGKLTSIGRYYNRFGKLTDKALYINDSMVVKEEYFYKGAISNMNAFVRKGNDFVEAGRLLYNSRGLFGLDNSDYYVVSSADSVPVNDSIRVMVDFVNANKKAHIVLSLGSLDENLKSVGRDRVIMADSLSVSFNYKPLKKGYNLILGKLLFVGEKPNEKVREYIFFHDFLAY